MSPSATPFAVFDTALGRCAIAWGERGVVCMQLPGASAAQSAARMRRRFAGAHEAPPPDAIRQAIDGITALLVGQAADLSGVVIDMARTPDFDRRVYSVARGIPPGATLSYGDVAARLGDPTLARAVGRSLGRNPYAVIVPCHRVLAAGGRIGGFSAGGGAATKRRLLLIEGARTGTEPGLFDDIPTV